MKLSFYGTAAVVLESKGCRLVFDPFLGMPNTKDESRYALMKKAFTSADAVLVTHGHFDHIYDIPKLYADRNIPIYATKTPCKTLSDLGVSKNRLNLIKPFDELDIGSFHIKVYQGRHCRFDTGVALETVFKPDTVKHPLRLFKLLSMNKAYPENGETLFYEIEAEGKRVQITGSMGLDENTRYPTLAEALILPFQGTCNPAKTVAPMLARLKPKAVYLDHYDDTFPPLSSQIKTDYLVNKLTRHGKRAEALVFAKEYII